MSRNLRLVVEYDGTDLCGWQRQANGPTVQGHLEAALHDLLGYPVAVAGASRTDAGVHAAGQVARFVTTTAIPAEGFKRALNTRLPPSIAVASVSDVDPQWHPRFSATGKHYRYLLWHREARSPRWQRFAWHRPRDLDVEKMAEAAGYFVGDHDFTAFRAVGCIAKTTIRRMHAVTVARDPSEPNLITIDVRGNAFLRNMVRIMAGTLVDIGEGRMAPTAIADMLKSSARTAAGQTAPALGLTLVAVRYDGVRLGSYKSADRVSI